MIAPLDPSPVDLAAENADLRRQLASVEAVALELIAERDRAVAKLERLQQLSLPPANEPYEGYQGPGWPYADRCIGQYDDLCSGDPEHCGLCTGALPEYSRATSPLATVTHGRHCPCSACAREDWTRADLAPCGMHGPACPAVYAPLVLGRIETRCERRETA